MSVNPQSSTSCVVAKESVSRHSLEKQSISKLWISMMISSSAIALDLFSHLLPIQVLKWWPVVCYLSTKWETTLDQWVSFSEKFQKKFLKLITKLSCLPVITKSCTQSRLSVRHSQLKRVGSPVEVYPMSFKPLRQLWRILQLESCHSFT